MLMLSVSGYAQTSKFIIYVNRDSVKIRIDKKFAGFAMKDSGFIMSMNPGEHFIVAQWEKEKLQSGKVFLTDGESMDVYFEFVSEKKLSYLERDAHVFLIAEQPATFNNGDLSSFNIWICENIKYPQEAVEKGIAGKIYVQFIVNENGDIEKAKVIKGNNPVLNAEAIRVIMASPKWSPAKDKGRLVKQMFTMPIDFNLTDIKK